MGGPAVTEVWPVFSGCLNYFLAYFSMRIVSTAKHNQTQSLAGNRHQVGIHPLMLVTKGSFQLPISRDQEYPQMDILAVSTTQGTLSLTQQSDSRLMLTMNVDPHCKSSDEDSEVGERDVLIRTTERDRTLPRMFRSRAHVTVV